MAHDGNVLTQNIAHALAGIEDCAGRLAHYPLGEVTLVRKSDHAAGARSDVLHQAVAGVGTRYHYHPLSLVELLAATLDHCSGALMAWGPEAGRVMLLWEKAVVFAAYVAATDRHLLQLYQALAVPGSRRIGLEDVELLGSNQSGRLHDNVSPACGLYSGDGGCVIRVDARSRTGL